MQPTTIHADPDKLILTWANDQKQIITAHALRCACPCASCVSEITGTRTLDTARIPQTITFTKVEPTGNYALSITFSDFHSTGIFTYDFLSSLMNLADISQPKTS